MKGDWSSQSTTPQCHAQAVVSKQNEGLNLEELQNKLSEGVKDVNDKMRNMPPDMMLLIGGTQVGKSIVMELLTCGVDNLVVEMEVGKASIKCPSKSKLIGGGGGTSCTKTPQPFAVHGMAIVDTPGMGDNRGSFTEIVGMHTLSQVANRAKRLKFLLVLPYDELVTDGDNSKRRKAYEFAVKFLNSVSINTQPVTAAAPSLGLLVNKVEEGAPDDDTELKKLILKALERDVKTFQNSDSPYLSTVLQAIQSNENVFWVRRPSLKGNVIKVERESYPLNEFTDKQSNKPIYETVREKLLEFCDEKLEYVRKPSQVKFTVNPSKETHADLYKNIYPKLAKMISHHTEKHLDSLLSSEKGRWKELSKTEKVDISYRLDSAYEFAPSSVLEHLAHILEQNLCKEEIYSLKRNEDLLDSLQKITGITSISTPETRKLLNQFKKKLYETERELKEDLIPVMKEGIKKLVKNIQRDYRARCTVWSEQAALYGLAESKIDEHLAALKEINISCSSNGDGGSENCSKVSSSLEIVFQKLSLTVTESVKSQLGKLNWAEKKTSSYANNLKNAVTEMKLFLEDEREMRKSEDRELQMEMEKKMDGTITANFETMTKNWLNQIIYREEGLNDLLSEIVNLELVVENMMKYRENCRKNCNDISTEVQFFNYQMADKRGTRRLDKFVWSFEVWQYQFMNEKCLDIWVKCVDSHIAQFQKLLEWYRYFHQLKRFCERRHGMQKKVKQLENVEANLLPKRFCELAQQRAAKNIGKLSGIDEVYLAQKTFKDVLCKIECLCAQFQNFWLADTPQGPNDPNSINIEEETTLFKNIIKLGLFFSESYEGPSQEDKYGEDGQKEIWKINAALDKIVSLSVTLEHLIPGKVSECEDDLQEICLDLVRVNSVQIDKLTDSSIQLVNRLKSSSSRISEENADGLLTKLTAFRECTENLCEAMDIFLGILLEEWEDNPKIGSEQYNRQSEFRLYLASLKLTDILENGLGATERQSLNFPKTPATINEIFTNRKYAVERNTFMEVVSSLQGVCKKVLLGDSLLILGNQKVLFSDFVGDLVDTTKKALNLLIVSGGTVFVDRDLVAENGKIKNLLICAAEIKCVGKRSIILQGENGEPFYTSATNGESWGADGKTGENGRNGGDAGNVCIVTKQKLHCPLLTITTRGGNGGCGQDGGNGYCGSDDEQSCTINLQNCNALLKEFDEIFKLLCGELKLNDSISLSDFHLDNSNQVKTPNANMYRNVQIRYFSLLALKFVMNCVTNQNTEEDDEEKEKKKCFCSALTHLTNFDTIRNYEEGSWEQLLTDKVTTGLACQRSENEQECPAISAIKKIESVPSDEEYSWSTMSELAVHFAKEYSGQSTSDEMLQLLTFSCNNLDDLYEALFPQKWMELAKSEDTASTATNLTKGLLDTFKLLKDYPRGDGGSGGQGGDGGHGGKPGSIKILPRCDNNKDLTCTAIYGDPGVGGKGGCGGQFGQQENDNEEEVEFGKDGVDGELGRTKLDVDDDGSESQQMSVADHLREWIENGGVDDADKAQVISILAEHPWAVEQVFTVDLLAEEYLRLAGKLCFNINSSNQVKQLEHHYQAEIKFIEIFENFLKQKSEQIDSSDDETNKKKIEEECNAIKFVLDCIQLKTMALHDHLQATPIIYNLEKYLSTCEKKLESYREVKRNAAAVTHQTTLVENLSKEIVEAEKKEQETISKSLEDLKKQISEWKNKLTDELAKRIAKIEEHEKYEVGKNMVKGAAMGAGAVAGAVFKISRPITMAANTAVTQIVDNVGPHKPKETSALSVTDQLNDEEQRQKDVREMVMKLMEIIEKTVKEHPEMKITFSKVSSTLESANEHKDHARCEELLTKARCEFLELLDKQRVVCGQSSELYNTFDFLYYEVAMSNVTASQLYGKDKKWWEYCTYAVYDTIASELAKARKQSIESSLFPTLDRLLDTLKLQLVEKELPRLKKLVEELQKYLESFVKGLSAEVGFKAVFEKINKTVKTYENSQDDIKKLEKEKRKVIFMEETNFIERGIDGGPSFGDKLNLREKVGKIHHLTKAQLLILDYVKIENAIKQAAFPYAACYLQPQQNRITRVHSTAISHNERADYCKELINHFKLEYSTRASQRKPEDDIWCMWYFSGRKGTEAECAKFWQDGTRRIDPPFFEWKQQEFGEIIRNLFLGQPVRLTADIRKSVLDSMAAVKINGSIRLQFSVQCSSSQTADEMGGYQRELDKLLNEKFVVKMTHGGTSYYKIALSDDQKPKYYKFCGDSLTVSENKVRKKMVDHVQSPFADWEFELELLPPCAAQKIVEFPELADKFAHLINLQLVGVGDFFQEEGWKDAKKAPLSVDLYYKSLNDF